MIDPSLINLMVDQSLSSSGGARIWVEGGGEFIYDTCITYIMWIYNIWDQFEKLKTIHLNTKWYLM